MKYLYLFCFFINSFYYSAQGPSIEWQRSYGGSNLESPASIQQTSDGGYVVIGTTTSTNGDVNGLHTPDWGYSTRDIWVVKLKSTGIIKWKKCLGGSRADNGAYIQQTSDGGFIVLGTTESNNNDVNGNHGGGDIWVIKLDSSGNISWQKCYGGTGNETGNCIKKTKDGGYIILGVTNSTNGDVTIGKPGRSFYWIIKLDQDTIITWQSAVAGSGYESAANIEQTTDGGYILAGNFVPDSTLAGCHPGNGEGLICKLSANGNIQWQKCLGAVGWDGITEIMQTSDKGYIVSGYSKSMEIVNSLNHAFDCWIIKLDSSGTITWQKNYGGSREDQAYSIKETRDGNFIFIAGTGSTDRDVKDRQANSYDSDCWVVKIDKNGFIIWSKSFGGKSSEVPAKIELTSDGGYVFLAATNSSDNNIFTHGDYDFWVVKFKPETAGLEAKSLSFFNIFPNPAEDFITIELTELITADDITVTIVDATGKKMQSQFTGEQKLQIDTHDLVQGIYLLNVNYKGQSVNNRFIINK